MQGRTFRTMRRRVEPAARRFDKPALSLSKGSA